MGCTVLQFSLGLIHHLVWKRTQRPTIMGRIHLFIGPIVVFTGAANGFLGFRFASSNHTLLYGIVVIAVFVGLVAVIYLAQSKKAKRTKVAGFPPDPSFERYGHQRGGVGFERGSERYEEFSRRGESSVGGGVERTRGDDIPLEELPRDEPPAYDEKPVRPRSLV